MNPWVPVLVTALIVALNAAVNYGVVRGAVSGSLKTLARDVAELKQSRKEQWEKINEHEVEIGKITTKLEMASKANGRGAHA